MELTSTQNPNLLGKELTDSPYVLQVNKNNNRNEHWGVHCQPTCGRHRQLRRENVVRKQKTDILSSAWYPDNLTDQELHQRIIHQTAVS